MHKELDGSLLMNLLYGENVSKEYNEYETIVKTITRTKTLVEDDTLLKNIVTFSKGRFCKSNHKPITLEDARSLNRQELLYRRINKNNKSGFEEVWSTSRWEGDYCNPYSTGCEKYSFNEIIKEYIKENPNKVQWKIQEKVVKEEIH